MKLTINKKKSLIGIFGGIVLVIITKGVKIKIRQSSTVKKIGSTWLNFGTV